MNLSFKRHNLQELTLGVMLGALFLSACNAFEDGKKELYAPNVSHLKVIETHPTQNATDFPLDGEILITLDQPIDAYSYIQDNFEIMDTDGNRIGGKKLISGKYITHPQNSKLITSQISIKLEDQFFASNTKYIVSWGDVKNDHPDANPNAFGIQNFYGAMLDRGGVAFTTGEKFTNFYKDELQVLSMGPARILAKGKTFDVNSDLGDLIDRSRSESYLTTSRFAPIPITFSEPIVDLNSQSDLEEHGFSELEPTPISDFPNMMVAVFDRETEYMKIFATMENLNPLDPESVQAWNEWRTSYEDRLNGYVYTTNSRKTLIFELAEGESYPDTTAQVVVVILWNVWGWQTNHKLKDNFVVGGFVHFSGFEVENPLAFQFDLPGGSQ